VIVNLNENPKITDTIRFQLLTPDFNGCLTTMPYKIDNITIYFVERDFTSVKTSKYQENTYDPAKIALANELEAVACSNPTSDNIEAAKKARALAEMTVSTSLFYFNDANPISVIGTATSPVWIKGNNITGISKANPTVITSASHGLSTGDEIYIYASNSVPPIDGNYKITYLTSNTFSVPFDLSDISYTAGTSGMWYTALDNSNNVAQPVVIDNKTSIGLFEFLWTPNGAREGDYFICWKYTPLAGGNSLSSHLKFSLSGNTSVTTSIPTHFTNPDKYTTLLERYTPEMFKTTVSDDDLSPSVIDRFNQSIAMGFTTLENLANQIVDLQDPNVIAEALIPYLSNTFNLKLKGNDPTRWRGQIVRAVTQFKKKGTLSGLQESFFLAGMKLLNYRQLWQVISKYTWQEAFEYDGNTQSWQLENVIIEPIDLNNFELSIRPFDSETYTTLTSSYVSFSTVDGVTTMTWVGDNLSVDPISLVKDDIVKVVYQIATVPNPTEQSLEEYIRTLELIDKRDERDQLFPLKNWNVRGLEQDDILFNLIIPNRHPFHDLLVFGQVRTEFPYSENIYNMEEYNGSIRNSKSPCDIGKYFIDPCKACIGSSYNIDIQIDAISDDRIEEFYEVLQENMPFHALLNTVNFFGGFQEFVSAPMESIECLIKHTTRQFCVAGEGQTYFNRAMKLSNLNNLPSSNTIFRDELADVTQVVSGATATAYNTDIVVYCPSLSLNGRGIREDHTSILQILDGSYSGSYYVYGVDQNMIRFDSSPTEPIDNCNNIFDWNGSLSTCSFPFRIINPVMDAFNYGSLCNIDQDDLVVLSDSTKDFGLLGVKTQFDVEQGTAVSAYEVSIPAYSITNYTILNVDPNGNLILQYDSSFPSSSASGVTYTIYNGATPVATGTTASLSITNRGRVTALNPNVLPISSMITGDNFYQTISGTDYEISSLVSGTDDQFYLANYNAGSFAGINMIVTRRMVDNVVGYMSSRGLNLQFTGIDYETTLGIQDGANNILPYIDPIVNNFMANYIIEVDGKSYWMTGINGNNPVGDTTINLSGPDVYWTTLSSGGTSVSVNIYKYESKGATIEGQQKGQPSHTFEKIDRSGSPNVTGTDSPTETVVASLSVNSNEGMPQEFINQKESVSYKIQYTNGAKEEGKL
jgi:hypothetical protein